MKLETVKNDLKVIRRRVVGANAPWRCDSTWDPDVSRTRPLAPDEVAQRNEEIDYLKRYFKHHAWSLDNGRLIERPQSWKMGLRSIADPTMSEGTYGGLAAYPLPGSVAALTLSATEQGLIPATSIPIYTPIPINGVMAPQAYRVILTGVFTSVATSGTLTMTPRLGNANTSPSLGASAAQTLTASLTNGQFYVMGDITIRSIGLPGANSTAIGTFHALANSTVGGATTSWLWGTGATAVSFDTTIAAGANGGGLWFGVTFSANFPTMTLQQIHMMDWN
jgi:hypothetical protein